MRDSAAKAGDINSEVYFEEGIEEGVVEKLRGQFFLFLIFLRGAEG